VVPPDPQHPIIRPGVIYCLKQTGATAGDTVNPLQPYFLVYILNDGVARFNFTHPKQILEIMRDLCSGQTSAYEDLCRLFDEQTQNGTDMSCYNDLLAKAIKAIEGNFRKRLAGSLLTDRNAILPERTQQVTEDTDFELITWLIIR
jgi:hypothetical protein